MREKKQKKHRNKKYAFEGSQFIKNEKKYFFCETQTL